MCIYVYLKVEYRWHVLSSEFNRYRCWIGKKHVLFDFFEYSWPMVVKRSKLGALCQGARQDSPKPPKTKSVCVGDMLHARR